MQPQQQPLKPIAAASSDSLSVAAIDAGASTAWDAFVTSNNGSFYHLFGWKDVNERSLGHYCEYLAARDSLGQIQGILPLVFVKSRLFGRILCSMPFMNYGGPVAASPQAADALTRAAQARASTLGADYLELRCPVALETTMPVSLRKVSMTVPLLPDPEALFNSFSQKHRKNIRRAQKNELTVRKGGIDLLEDFFHILELSWRSLGTPMYSKGYFKHLLETFPENTSIFTCSWKGAPVAATLVGHFNGVVEGMWAGARQELRHLDANYVLYWEMLRDACQAGHKLFHLGRSTSQSGAEQFKSKWNAETHQLYWYFHRPDGGPMPQLNVDNPKFRLAIAAWRKLPLWATRIVGPPIARLIP
jgi:FemAB-related protein (PEP-CTERM system-associated)